MAALPQILLDLRADLEARGFDVLPIERTGTFDNQHQLLEGLLLRAAIGIERSVPFLQLSAVGMRDDEWFDLDLWRSCVEAVPPPTEARPLDDQASYLRGHLEELHSVASDIRALRSCLDVVSRRRAEQRYGIHLGE